MDINFTGSGFLAEGAAWFVTHDTGTFRNWANSSGRSKRLVLAISARSFIEIHLLILKEGGFQGIQIKFLASRLK
jgi:hypothetical protein